MESNSYNSNQQPVFETASSDSTLRSVQFKVESASQRLFDSSYSNAALAYSDRGGSNADRAGRDPFQAFFTEGNKPKDKSADRPTEGARGPVYAASASGD